MQARMFGVQIVLALLFWMAFFPVIAFGASSQSVGSLKDVNSALFPGEVIDLFQGAIKFAVKEISLPGPNGLDINVYREWDVAQGFNRSHQDWDAPQETRFIHTFPRIEVLGTRSLTDNSRSCEKDAQFCSHTISLKPGLMLKIPGMEPMVLFHQNNNSRFDGSSTSYFSNPNNNWRAYLLPQPVREKNPLEVRVFSPDGFRYDFSKNQVVVRDAVGNTITYTIGGNYDTYQGKSEYVETHLKKITASDGRKVDFSYSYQNGGHHQVNKMTVDTGTGEPRVWTYKSQHSVRGFTSNNSYCTYTARNAGPPRDQREARDACLNQLGGKFADYIGDNSITEVTDPEGRVTTINYSGNKIASYSLPDGGKVVYGYNGNLLSLRRVLDRDGTELNRTSYEYSLAPADNYIDEENRVAKSVTATKDNAKTSYHFYTDSTYSSDQYRFGEVRRVVWHSLDGKVLQEHDFTYDAGPSTCRHADGSPWQRSECTQTRLNSITLDGAFKTTYSNFTSLGQPQTITHNGIGINRQIEIEYFNQAPNSSGTRHAFFGLIAKRSIVGQGNSFVETTAHYNTKGQLEHEASRGVTSVFTYYSDGAHDRGNLKSISVMDNGIPLTTSFSNYFRGQARSITNALGHTVSNEVNGFGQITKTTDPEGHSVSFEFDKLGRLTRETASDRSPIESYYGEGFSSQKNLHTGVGEIERRDGWGRTISVESGLMLSDSSLNYGSQVIAQHFVYSEDELTMYEDVPHYYGSTKGRFVKEVDALGRIVLKGFDDPAAYKTTYCYELSCLPFSPAQLSSSGYLDGQYAYKITGKSKSFEVSVLDRFGAMGELLPVAHFVLNRDKLDEFESSVMTYNARGQLTNVTKNGIERSFTYDPVYGELKTISEPETGQTTFTFSALGQLWQKRVNGQLLQEFSYDEIGRLTEVSDGEVSLKQFTYFPDGSIKTAWTPEAKIEFTYDGSNAVTSKNVLMEDGNEWNLSISRTPDGLIDTVNISPEMKLRYSYDEFRRPKAVYGADGPDSQLEQIAYNDLSPVGLVREMRYGNGLREISSHDNRGRPVSRTLQSHSSGLVHVREEYYIDDENMVAGIHDQLEDVWMLGETDYRGYLVGTSGIWGLRDFSYDEGGNLLSVRTGTEIKELIYDINNRFSKTKNSGVAATYDNRGNTTSLNGHNITYDAFDRVHSVSGVSEINGEAYSREYGYDAFGNRVRIHRDGSLIHLHFGPGDRPFSEIDQTKGGVKTNIYLGGRHVAQSYTVMDGTAISGDSNEGRVYEQATPCLAGGTYAPQTIGMLQALCLYEVGELESDRHTYYLEEVCPYGQSSFEGDCYELANFECSKYGRVTPQTLQEAIYGGGGLSYCGKAIPTTTGSESCPSDLATRRTISGFGASTVYCYDKTDRYVQCPTGYFAPAGSGNRTCYKNSVTGAATIEPKCRSHSVWGSTQATPKDGVCWVESASIQPDCPAGYTITEGKNLITDWQDPDACVMSQSPETTLRYYHQDIFKSVDLVTNETGNVISRKRFSPYGIEEGTEGGDHSDYGFLGKRVERDAGVSLLGPRAYLPVISRFLSPDPINVDSGGLGFFNRYAYGINNPLKYVDPTGFFAEKSMPSHTDREGLGGKADGDAKGLGAAVAGALAGSKDDDLDALFSSKELSKSSRQVAIAPAVWGAIVSVGAKLYKPAKSWVKNAFKAPVTKDIKALSAQQQKAIRSLEKQIAKHEKKVQDFKENPTVRPGMENLPKEVIQKQQQRRIQHLETEINTFRNNIQKIMRGEIDS